MIECHDKSRFDVSALSIGPDDRSQMQQRLRRSFDNFIDIDTSSDAAIASRIRMSEIDILIDLQGFTEHSRTNILAHRPAPIQVNYLGYPGTMGAQCFDYIIADRYIVPEELQRCYSEKIVYLPDTFQANDSKRPRPEIVPSRTELGLPEDAFVLCCFNHSYKLTPSIFDIWMRLLRKIDGSVLWILAPNPAAEQNIRREAATRGVDSRRIVLAPRVPYEDYLARYKRADLFLDTLPFNAGTTASDALWCGLPVVTCPGETFASRMAGSLLRAAGVPELIAASLDDYEEITLRLAYDRTLLTEIKSRLASQCIPLFNTELFTRNIETAYAMMHARHRAGLTPDHIVVPH